MVEAYGFGRIVIDGREYLRDVVILPDGVKSDWWRAEGHLLQMADLGDVLAAKPDLLVVGTGSAGAMLVADEVGERLEREGIELVSARAAEACEEYNRRCGAGRVAAALHLTC